MSFLPIYLNFKPTGLKWKLAQTEERLKLHIVVERKLIRMRTKPHGVNLIIEFVADPILDEVFRKDPCASQEPMIFFQAL